MVNAPVIVSRNSSGTITGLSETTGISVTSIVVSSIILDGTNILERIGGVTSLYVTANSVTATVLRTSNASATDLSAINLFVTGTTILGGRLSAIGDLIITGTNLYLEPGIGNVFSFKAGAGRSILFEMGDNTVTSTAVSRLKFYAGGYTYTNISNDTGSAGINIIDNTYGPNVHIGYNGIILSNPGGPEQFPISLRAQYGIDCTRATWGNFLRDLYPDVGLSANVVKAKTLLLGWLASNTNAGVTGANTSLHVSSVNSPSALTADITTGLVKIPDLSGTSITSLILSATRLNLQPSLTSVDIINVSSARADGTIIPAFRMDGLGNIVMWGTCFNTTNRFCPKISNGSSTADYIQLGNPAFVGDRGKLATTFGWDFSGGGNNANLLHFYYQSTLRSYLAYPGDWYASSYNSFCVTATSGTINILSSTSATLLNLTSTNIQSNLVNSLTLNATYLSSTAAVIGLPALGIGYWNHQWDHIYFAWAGFAKKRLALWGSAYSVARGNSPLISFRHADVDTQDSALISYTDGIGLGVSSTSDSDYRQVLRAVYPNKLGINTSAPRENFHVSGTTALSGNISAIGDITVTGTNLYLEPGNGGDFGIRAKQGRSLIFEMGDSSVTAQSVRRFKFYAGGGGYSNISNDTGSAGINIMDNAYGVNLHLGYTGFRIINTGGAVANSNPVLVMSRYGVDCTRSSDGGFLRVSYPDVGLSANVVKAKSLLLGWLASDTNVSAVGSNTSLHVSSVNTPSALTADITTGLVKTPALSGTSLSAVEMVVVPGTLPTGTEGGFYYSLSAHKMYYHNGTTLKEIAVV